MKVKTSSFIKILGFVVAALCSLGAFMAWRAGQGSASPGFLIMAAIGLLLPLLSGSVEADDYFITSAMPLWKFEIRWDEVTYIEVDRDGHSLVFVGEQKRLPIWGPFYWAADNREELGKLIVAQMEKRHIPFRHTQKAVYRLPKNTRVR